MLRRIISNWWIVNIRGVLAIMFGIFALSLSGRIAGRFGTAMVVVSVLALFILYLILYAVLSIFAAMRSLGHSATWWTSLIHAAFLFAFAAWAFFSPHLTIAFLLYFMIAHSLVTGVLEAVFTHKVRKHPLDQLLLGFAALVSLSAGTVLFLMRHTELEVMIRAIGVYTIFFGLMLVLFSFRLHAFRRPEAHVPQRP